MRRLIRAAALSLALAVLAAGLLYVFRQEDAPISGGSSAALGMMLLEKEKGLYVLAVTQDSPADKAGISPGDYLLRAGETALDSVEQLDLMTDAAERELSLLLRRSGEELRIRLPSR